MDVIRLMLSTEQLIKQLTEQYPQVKDGGFYTFSFTFKCVKQPDKAATGIMIRGFSLIKEEK